MSRLLSLLLCAAYIGCDRAPAPAILKAPVVTTYEVKGVLQEVLGDGRKAVITHENIPGYMAAMTMQFEAASAADLGGLAPGDVLAFRLSVMETHSSIDRVRKLGHTTPTPRVATGEGLPPGTPLPDCELLDSRGQTLQLSSFKGRALAFTFIFTRCPLPDYCPRMNLNLGAVQSALANDAAANWHLLSLSFDPDYDTPERLAKYAEPYQPDPAHWTFATGRADEVRALGTAFGLAFSGTGAALDHNLRTVVVDAAGRVQKVFTGNEWKAEELIAEMRKAMTAQP